MLPKGSTVDLILGDGFGNLKVTIPNLVGLTYDEAVFVLQASRLMIGAIIFDGNSRDTLNARVYKQSPEFTTDTLRSRLSQGEAIDLYLKDN
jgi:beta-lactam-binding protein with PASTA domain